MTWFGLFWLGRLLCELRSGPLVTTPLRRSQCTQSLGLVQDLLLLFQVPSHIVLAF